jgi:hypothetical protein
MLCYTVQIRSFTQAKIVSFSSEVVNGQPDYSYGLRVEALPKYLYSIDIEMFNYNVTTQGVNFSIEPVLVSDLNGYLHDFVFTAEFYGQPIMLYVSQMDSIGNLGATRFSGQIGCVEKVTVSSIAGDFYKIEVAANGIDTTMNVTVDNALWERCYGLSLSCLAKYNGFIGNSHQYLSGSTKEIDHRIAYIGPTDRGMWIMSNIVAQTGTSFNVRPQPSGEVRYWGAQRGIVTLWSDSDGVIGFNRNMIGGSVSVSLAPNTGWVRIYVWRWNPITGEVALIANWQNYTNYSYTYNLSYTLPDYSGGVGNGFAIQHVRSSDEARLQWSITKEIDLGVGFDTIAWLMSESKKKLKTTMTLNTRALLTARFMVGEEYITYPLPTGTSVNLKEAMVAMCNSLGCYMICTGGRVEVKYISYSTSDPAINLPFIKGTLTIECVRPPYMQNCLVSFCPRGSSTDLAGGVPLAFGDWIKNEFSYYSSLDSSASFGINPSACTLMKAEIGATNGNTWEQLLVNKANIPWVFVPALNQFKNSYRYRVTFQTYTRNLLTLGKVYKFSNLPLKNSAIYIPSSCDEQEFTGAKSIPITYVCDCFF